MFWFRLSQNGISKMIPSVKTIAMFPTTPATSPRIQNIFPIPTGCSDPESITLCFNTRFAGVWPEPAVIAAQISQPIPRVIVASSPSTR